MISRRDVLMSTLFGAGWVGLRALATGLPAAVLLDPRRALANVPAAGGAASQAQFVILSTSSSGDPINASVPGTYADPEIVHSSDPSMAPTSLVVGGQQCTAAAPWATLPASVLARTCFWHLATQTPVHPQEPNVLALMLQGPPTPEMLPSMLAKQLAPVLGTIQTQPLCIGATTPSEGLLFSGQPLPIIPPTALRDTLTNPTGPLSNLQGLRDQMMNKLYALYGSDANTAQKAYIDSLATSQTQVRSINQSLLNQLSSIKDNTAASQIVAAITLIQMKVAPVISIHIPFGGDNHADTNLQTETAETISGVQTIASLMSQLQAAGLQDQVTFMTLNVFGRTLGGNGQGRQHNPNHQASITIGKPFKGGVVGGVAPTAGDYGAVAFSSQTGAASASGDVSPKSSLPAFGATMLAAVGASASTLSAQLPSGIPVVTGALAS